MTSSAVASSVGGIVTPKCAHATLSDAKMAHCMCACDVWGGTFMNRMLCALAFGAILLASPAAWADQAVSVGGAMALLNVAYMRKVARPVVVAGTSRGTLRVPSALAGKPDGIVLTAGFLDQVKSAIGSPGSLARTLIVHHRQDGCRSTPPSAVEPFRAWGGSRVRVAWMEGGLSSGDPCKARADHGFNGLVVSTVAQFAVSAR